MTTRFKSIAMVLLFFIAIPMFAEDVFTFSFQNSLFSRTINNSDGETDANQIFSLDKMAAGDVSMPRKSNTNWTPIVVTLVIVGGLLLGGLMYISVL